MSECSRCKKPYSECDLQWVEVPSEDSIQIIWTGRGHDESKEKKMGVICDNCKKEDTTSSSSSS